MNSNLSDNQKAALNTVKALQQEMKDGPVIKAQHVETGHIWEGLRSRIPERYYEIAASCGPSGLHGVSGPDYPGPICERDAERDFTRLSASSILQQAIDTVKQRGRDYNNPSGERSMKAAVEAFNAITGLQLTTLQGWMFMCVLKLVRGQQSPAKLDNWLDLSAYGSLAGEEALK